tara:strand:- start:18 stop:1643 length:1626 start_codon:yes stop_codon:yes gene_type:complete
MSKCLNCGKTTPTNSRTYKPKKYCDNKCANKFYSKDKRYSENPRWDWGEGNKKKEQEKQKKLERLRELQDTMVDRQEVLVHFGMKNPTSIRKLVIELGIKDQSVKIGPHEKHVFYSKEDAKLLTDVIQEKWGHKLKEVPEGYIHTNEVSKIMNVARINTELFENKVQVFEKAGWFIDKQEVLDYVQKRDEAKAKAKERREAKEEEIAFRERLRREKKESKALQKKQWHVDQKEQDLKREEFLSKGWIDASEACDLGAPKNIKYSSQKFGIRTIAFTHNLAKLYNREDVLKHVSYLKKLDEAKLKGAFGVKRGGQIVILKDQNDPFPYETRMFNLKFPEWKNVKKKLKSIKTNELYRDQHFNHNKIVELKCGECEQYKPYHEFRYAPSKRGRRIKCKACEDKRYQDNKEEVSNRMKERWKIPWVKMRVIICSQIKKDISFVIGKYFEVQTSTIWNEIQKQCGYNEHDLVKHIQNQFGPKMSWDNHARSSEGFRWEIDHVVSRSELRYDSLNHPNFKKCWGLDNLRPLCAKENKSRWFIDKQT